MGVAPADFSSYSSGGVDGSARCGMAPPPIPLAWISGDDTGVA
jgi:hypothetical protein